MEIRHLAVSLFVWSNRENKIKLDFMEKRMEGFRKIKIDEKDFPEIKEDEGKSKSSILPKRRFVMVMLIFVAMIGIGIGGIGLGLCFERDSEADYLGEQIIEKDNLITELQKTLTKCGGATDISSETATAPRNSLLHLDEGKCLNCEIPIDSIIGKAAGFSSDLFSFIRLNTSTASDATIAWVSWEALNEYYSYIGTTNIVKAGIEWNVKIELLGKAVDSFIESFGNGRGGETLFFLMEDGTVEYIPVIKAIQEGKFQSFGKIPGVESVVKFYTAHNYGGLTPLAQRADGDYYDLSSILLNTGDYQF